ncbi:MAG: hypothetical protein ABIV51_08880 [Saprospiraceae bacterium]
MKKTWLSLGIFLLFTGLIVAQDDTTPDKAVKKASRALSAYNLDTQNNGDKLDEAKKYIDYALNDAAVQADGMAWLTAGQIYAEISNKDALTKMVNKNFKAADPNAAIKGFEFLKKAYNLVLKPYEKKDALNAMKELVPSISQAGLALFEQKDFAGAYSAFYSVIEAHDLLKANKMESPLDKPDDYNNQLYISGLAAQNANMPDKAVPLYEKLYATNFDNVAVYDGLFKLKMEAGKEDEALKILEAGRMRYPADLSLSYSEINYYLKKGKLNELTDKLKSAIANEPSNVSLYTTLGNVYDQLYQKETDAAKGQAYVDDALKYYRLALEKDPKSVDANYSIGALYFNKAAILTQDMKKMESDYSAAGIKKFDALNKDVMKMFDQALPYFKRAESLNANDKNTLIALKEIFARQNDLEKANEFKKRLETIEGGGKNSVSYFKE